MLRDGLGEFRLNGVLRSSLYQVRARLRRAPSTRRATMMLSSLFERSFQRLERPLPLPASHPGYHRFHVPEDPKELPLGRMTDLRARLRANQLVGRSRFHHIDPQPSERLPEGYSCGGVKLHDLATKG